MVASSALTAPQPQTMTPNSPPRPAQAFVSAPLDVRSAPAAYRSTPPTAGDYAIQVGAFGAREQARFATAMARQADFAALRSTHVVLQSTEGLGSSGRSAIFWRARLAGLTRGDAAQACRDLQTHGMACMIVTPGN